MSSHINRLLKTQTANGLPKSNGSEQARGHDLLLAPPPRPVPAALPPYLILLATQFGWLFLGIGMFAFWFNCAFGADIKAALFLAPTRTVAGTVTGFERTPLIEGTGTSYVAGDPRYSTGTQPIFAVHYNYPLPGGGTERGTSYEGDTADFGPTTETAGSSLWKGTPPPPGQYTADREDVAVGMHVPVQYVRAFPSASRIQGMRSNIYPAYALGVLVFALVGVVLLRPAFRNLRRVRFLLGMGVEDAEHRTLEDPEGHLLNLSLEDPVPRLMGIQAGQLHAPVPLAWSKVLLLPVGGLLANASYLWHHWAAIVYTWHSLTS